MDTLVIFFNNLLDLINEASPWLLLGLIIAGLMKSFVPTKILSKHLGEGRFAVVKAAFIGAPLPLCSCGVIPVATQLKRSGASSPATSSFLVATPETGVDSVSVSYALLGPIMAIYRPIAAISSAIITGMLVSTDKSAYVSAAQQHESCCTKQVQKPSCCASKQQSASEQFFAKLTTGVRYSFTQLIDDLIKWLALGLLFAALIRTFVPTEFLTQYGSGLPAMMLMIVISVPMYICATASTPIAAGFIFAGISPGTALVFMMAGPATNISTLGVIKTEMGTGVLIRYLAGLILSAVAFGFLLDYLLAAYQINIIDQMSHSHQMLPGWFAYLCSAILVCAAIKPLRSLILK
ncbi:SO_0444 family Cu/Zn efflux transporter [Thalassotalea sp. Y01]|uniref:SO_0444 family Cu/Zn efflux transporter n=1 Tax=Thalassotalea sp. Y01 TaxID=2729613 RepID=UPI00145D7BBE|nr:SO_0444 family Cu/Zn efflux transporter [Thalassotalea sp. Y01]NMP17317.1 SO_0444 family Cu/Zn efflux transporter [Thalassotalea sp. Y01]